MKQRPRSRVLRTQQKKPHGGLSNRAYRAILEGLFDRSIPAGSILSQDDLVRLIGVPLQPLRDALRVLETEGVLTIHPRSGIEFRRADLELARSTYQFRSIIERAGARSYAENGDVVEIARQIDEHEAFVAALLERGFAPQMQDEVERLEIDLHGSMIASLRNPLVETTAKRLRTYVMLIRMDHRITQPLLVRSMKEHLDILRACQRRDADGAEAALVRHFQAALQRIIGMD